MRTLNVLIVDDEVFVVDWLTSIFDAERSMSLNLFSCYGVEEARSIIRENRIDILMTDIRMPDGNGLDLVDEIHRHWADCKVLMLTAYSEFEYAQRAIQSGVDGYILKTEKDDYILSEMRRVVDELNHTLDERQQKTSIQRDLDHYRHSYRSAVFFHWLRGHYMTAEQLKKCAADMELVSGLPVYLVIGRIYAQEDGKSSEINALHVRLSGMCMLAESAEYIFAELSANDVCFLIQPKPDYVKNYQGQMESLFEIVSSSCGSLYNVSVSFAISSTVEDGACVPELFRQLNEVLKNTSSESFVYRLPCRSTPPKKQHGFSGLVGEILELIEKKDETGCMEMIDRMEAAVSDAESVQDKAYQNAYLSVAVALMDCLLRQEDVDTGDLSLVYAPTAHGSVAEAFAFLKGTAARMFGGQDWPPTDKKSLLVDQIDAYISDNVSRDISLTDISQHFNYNSSYLSRLYSNVTGSTLKATIVKHRLKYIEHLMRDENLSLNEILERSSFKSRSYFNFFIKHTLGVTPSQYRQSLLEEKKRRDKDE